MRLYDAVQTAVALSLLYARGVSSSKPTRKFAWPLANISTDISQLLEGTHIQIDQTGDPSHAVILQSPYTTCGAAPASDVNACLAECHSRDIGQPDLLKLCVTGCHGLQTCNNYCAAHTAASYVSYGFELMLGINQSCSHSSSPDVNGTDITSQIPNPIYMGCRLTRLRIDLSDDITKTELIAGKGLHLNLNINADDPTMRCGVGLENPTWHHSNLDLYFNPTINNHKVSWAGSSSFNVDVSWWGDGGLDITPVVKSAVSKFMNKALSNPTVALDISKALTYLLARDIKASTGDDVDDFITIVVSDPNTVMVTYTPVCPDDNQANCGCSTSCNGLHYCDGSYWNGTAPSCQQGQTCLTTGNCCQPHCDSGGCGSDGCGGSCGICPAGQMCALNRCKACPVDNNCSSHPCRPNACGVWCGSCKPGWFCSDGGCQSSGPPGKPPTL